ncbi:MAG: hypothetical protein HFG70_14165 [Hungatella sp.]|nr:hypothetical protein [Hungatella sp.]
MKIQRVKFLLTVICLLAAGICYSCSGRTDRREPEERIVTTVLQTEEASGDRDVQIGLISAETEAQEREPGDTGEESWDEPLNRQGESVRFYVHICGQVRNPGVYEMEPGSRLFQAVELAGGFTEEAARDYLNMALEVGDGMKITVPSFYQVENNGPGQSPGSAPEKGDGQTQDGAAKGRGGQAGGSAFGSAGGNQAGAGTWEPWIEAPGGRTDEAGTEGASSGKVNLNTATKEELMTLRGIGEARAEDIIRYREEQGGFGAIEEIMNVSGIKEAAFQKIKDSITVQEGAH